MRLMKHGRSLAEYAEVIGWQSAARLNGDGYFAEGDPIHFNAAGADAMAGQLANALRARGLVARRVPRTAGDRSDSQNMSASPPESIR
jgi:hypothetical protein